MMDPPPAGRSIDGTEIPMKKPEPGLRLELGYYELGELRSLMVVALSDYPYIGEHAGERIKPILRKINEYLEYIDGA